MDENGSENGTGSSNVMTAQDARLDDRDWGPVDDDDTIILTMPNRAHDWVKVKKYITEADDAAAAQAAIAKGISFNAQTNGNRAARRANGNGKNGANSDDSQTQTYHFDTVAQRTVMLQRMIRDWSFKDKRSGAPLPVTAATIGALPVFTRDWIMERLDALNPSADTIDESAEEELDQHGNNTGPLGEPTSVSF